MTLTGRTVGPAFCTIERSVQASCHHKKLHHCGRCTFFTTRSNLTCLRCVTKKCRCLGNYSSMVAIIMGLNAAPVRRLRRSWGLVSARYLAQLNVCEAIIDPYKNFNNYRQALATISPPCVPYIGQSSLHPFLWFLIVICNDRGIPQGSLIHS